MSTNYEVSGTIKRISATQDITQSFRKREVVVTTEEQYPQHLAIEFVQDKTALLDNFREGDTVNIGINLRGREWTSPQGEVKYFNSLQGWRIEKTGASTTESAAGSKAPEMPPLEDSGEDDDLPF